MEAVQQALAVLFVFGLLATAVWKLRGGSPLLARNGWNRARGTARSLEAVERVALTPQHAIHLVRVHGREMIVMTHPQGCSVVQQTADRVDA
jgi:hypothetical protein